MIFGSWTNQIIFSFNTEICDIYIVKEIYDSCTTFTKQFEQILQTFWFSAASGRVSTGTSWLKAKF